jgi:zinc/manganese transport system substrate-binding protein
VNERNVSSSAIARRALACLVAAIPIACAAAFADPVRIVAAELVYGGVCEQLGGDRVAVVSVLVGPTQDPHQFEASASVAREVERAQLVVYNGADYDPWMARLLSASRQSSRHVLSVAELVRKKPGDNPHLWYDTAAVSALAEALAGTLAQLDPAHGAAYAQRGATFQASMRTLGDRIADFRRRHAGTAVTATEPVFEYMAQALGLSMRNRRFQLAVMNGTEPSAREIAAFEDDLRGRSVEVLIFNRQTGGRLAERMRRIADTSGIAVVGIAETQPPGSTYQAWMTAQIDALDRALAARPRWRR